MRDFIITILFISWLFSSPNYKIEKIKEQLEIIELQVDKIHELETTVKKLKEIHKDHKTFKENE